MPIETVTETVQTEQIIDQIFVCNACGLRVSYKEDPIEAQEFFVKEFVGGYGSVFGDGTHVELCLCQHCTMRLIGHYFIDKETGKLI